MAGAAVAQIIVPPLTNQLIDALGWRGAFTALGFGWGTVAFLVCAFLFYDARDRGRKAMKTIAAARDLRGLSLAEAWRSPSLWKIAISTFLIMTVTLAVLIHQVDMLGEAGVSRSNAALLASLGGVAGIVGKLMTGWLMDRYPGRWVGGITLAITSLTFFLLFQSFGSPALIVVAMMINGYAGGAKLQICGYLTSRYAGLLHFGTIFGFMASVIAAGSGLGPVLGGLIYDHFGSYTVLFIIGIAGSLISGLLLATLAPYPDWDTAEGVA